jgi:glycosidase
MRWWVALVASASLACGCDTEQDPPDGAAGAAASGGQGAAGGADGGAGGGKAGQGGAGGAWDGLCPTTFHFTPPFSLSAPRVAGEWHGFDLASATELTGSSASGEHTATVALPPGLHAYKIVYDADGDTHWIFDPGEGRRKYVGGVENSAVLVADCSLARLEVNDSEASASGTFSAALGYVAPVDGSAADVDGYEATLRHEGSSRALTSAELAVSAGGDVTLLLSGLEQGKYTATVTPASSGGAGEAAELVFWIEDEPFSWDGALIYMVVTDRYRDGEPSSNAPPVSGADPRGDFAGGDLHGLRQSIAEGVLDELGVRAIWLTPFNENPAGAYIASDNQTLVTGYHGYWPIKAREVDPRLGGAAALEALVAEAHRHGIRVLMDFVINHVHQEHEYMAAHPDWFRTGCVCGTDGCDWTSHALDCMFRDYLPDIDHTVPEANQQFVDDGLWWLDRFDLDGLRVDAVKHVEEIATRNLAAAVRERFERAGTRYFLMGETAMGWNDCADPCNDENYGTIARYVGPQGLDGQFDFVLYHGVSYRTFAYGDKGMLHADYWVQHGLTKWPAGAVMTPYIGSHDTARFATLADYRGQDGAHDRGIPGNQWSNTAVAPGDAEPYRRTRVAMSWLLTLPGAPLLYYGDEYGQWGGSDPNNRLMWRPEGQLSGEELATLAHVRALGGARRQLGALQRGAYLSLGASEDTLRFARHDSASGETAIVALTRLAGGDSVTVDVSALGLASGTVLEDALGGPDVVVSGGSASFAVPSSGAVILSPQ